MTGSNGFDQKNYDVRYFSGDLTINRRAITLTASDQEKIYGNVFELDGTTFTVKDLDGDGGWNKDSYVATEGIYDFGKNTDTIVPDAEWELTIGDKTADYTIASGDELQNVVEGLVSDWNQEYPNNEGYTVTQVSGESKIKVERNNSDVSDEVRFGLIDKVLPNNENEQIESLKLISINNKDTSTFANANDDENRSYTNEIKVQ